MTDIEQEMKQDTKWNKKLLLIPALAVTVGGGGYLLNAGQVAHVRQPPVMEASSCRMEDNSQQDGWVFRYMLVMPAPPPHEAVERPFSFCIPKGDYSTCLHAKRLKEVDTAEDALAEAEACADVIENIHR